MLGTGASLPGPAVETDAFIDLVSARFGLTRTREARTIARRMAIDSRHFCRPFETRHEPARAGHTNPDLVAHAVTAALEDAGLAIGDIGYLVGHTTTPLQPIPSNIALAADRLGYRGPHVELRQACTGFANALMIAFGLLAAPDARPVVLVGSETGSLWFDPARAQEDSGQLVNMVQMGDGAAAIVLGHGHAGRPRLHSAWFGAIGLDRAPGLQMRNRNHEFDHDFTAIRATGSRLFDAGAEAAARHGIAIDTAQTIVPHQVSGRIGDHITQHFGLSCARTFVNAGRIGNTGSAAIWLALTELRAKGLTSGDRILALGAEATKHMYGGFAYDHA